MCIFGHPILKSWLKPWQVQGVCEQDLESKVTVNLKNFKMVYLPVEPALSAFRETAYRNENKEYSTPQTFSSQMLEFNFPGGELSRWAVVL